MINEYKLKDENKFIGHRGDINKPNSNTKK